MSSSESAIASQAQNQEEETAVKRRVLKGWQDNLVRVIAILMTCFQVYTAYFGIFTAFRHRSLHILFILLICFLFYRSSKSSEKGIPWYDWLLCAGALFSYGYMIIFAHPLSSRHMLVTDLTPVQLAAGIIGIIVLVEGCRRAIGNAFTVVVVGTLAYALFGDMLPGLLTHRGFTLMWIVDQLYFTWEGIFGIPLSVSATYVFIFILFANFLKVTGVGDYFIDLAFAAFGKYRGGPAKTALFASGLMGMISGSAVANVAATGSLTIPMMKKVGYKPIFAGSVEAVASTGGQFIPPVMGAAAFIMAEFTGRPYLEIVVAAIVPALLYYLATLFQVHFEAVRVGLHGMKKEELPKVNFFRYVHYFIPIIVIIAILVTGRSPLYAGMVAFVAVLVVTAFNKETRVNLRVLANGFESAAKGAVEVAIACAGAGIVVGVITMTGVGTRFGSAIVGLAGGDVFLTLVFTMVVAIIFGMGLPPVAAYVLQAALLAPTLAGLGVPVLAAHLFCFYFAMLSNITPPVALAGFAAGAIANADPFKTGVNAMRIGSAAYIVPYAFVYGPALLLQGTASEIILAVSTGIAGVFALAIASIGYFKVRVSVVERILFAVSSVLLIIVNWQLDIVGIALLAAAIVIHLLREKKINENAVPETAEQ